MMVTQVTFIVPPQCIRCLNLVVKSLLTYKLLIWQGWAGLLFIQCHIKVERQGSGVLCKTMQCYDSSQWWFLMLWYTWFKIWFLLWLRNLTYYLDLQNLERYHVCLSPYKNLWLYLWRFSCENAILFHGLNHLLWPHDPDLWPMTLVSTWIIDIINDHLHAKFRDSRSNNSNLIWPKLKSVGALKMHIIMTWALNEQN